MTGKFAQKVKFNPEDQLRGPVAALIKGIGKVLGLAVEVLVDLCKEKPIRGLQEMRRSSLIDIDKVALAERMQAYYDPKIDWATLKTLKTGLTEGAGMFDPKSCRERVLKAGEFDEHRIKGQLILANHLKSLVAGDGIEPPTRGFSVLKSGLFGVLRDANR